MTEPNPVVSALEQIAESLPLCRHDDGLHQRIAARALPIARAQAEREREKDALIAELVGALGGYRYTRTCPVAVAQADFWFTRNGGRWRSGTDEQLVLEWVERVRQADTRVTIALARARAAGVEVA